ncbi:hypothetical protein LY90DRAFT_511349 [Neocallimastix californiae]|uniref:Ketopantoate reductase N-terminal domain-containing protein n=1 Tax=Neocallimastix californiae TaxID=1754190 RepID=A0A1Y2BQY4_9FUNG|nr:hypothetical protein LY90DRAFT_511349 [Neocallimastix californiae]|eukprot:ORY37158.1 hypothetical protein LY90DRAFT_511349 [Neocallimastix californiae]
MAEENQTEVLIIGAGNIGRVYGYHLFKGGAKIHYYVREHNKQNLINYPLIMHGLSSVIRLCNKTSTEKFSDYTVTTDKDISNGNAPNLPEHLDYVIFTVPAHRLSEGDWLKTLITFINDKYQKNVYYTSPIPDETGMERLLNMDKCLFLLCSFSGPKYEPRSKDIIEKDNEEKNPNKVIVFCPTIPDIVGNLTEEAKEAADKYVNILNKGGLKTINIKKDTEYGINALLAAPLFTCFAMFNWNFYNIGRNLDTMSLMTASLCEVSIKIVPFIPTLLFASVLILIHFISLYVCSFDIEAFCNAHFKVKLGEQTDYWNNIINSEAEKYDVDITNFKKLIKQYKETSKKMSEKKIK